MTDWEEWSGVSDHDGSEHDRLEQDAEDTERDNNTSGYSLTIDGIGRELDNDTMSLMSHDDVRQNSRLPQLTKLRPRIASTIGTASTPSGLGQYHLSEDQLTCAGLDLTQADETISPHAPIHTLKRRVSETGCPPVTAKLQKLDAAQLGSTPETQSDSRRRTACQQVDVDNETTATNHNGSCHEHRSDVLREIRLRYPAHIHLDAFLREHGSQFQTAKDFDYKAYELWNKRRLNAISMNRPEAFSKIGLWLPNVQAAPLTQHPPADTVARWRARISSMLRHCADLDPAAFALLFCRGLASCFKPLVASGEIEDTIFACVPTSLQEILGRQEYSVDDILQAPTCSRESLHKPGVYVFFVKTPGPTACYVGASADQEGIGARLSRHQKFCEGAKALPENEPRPSRYDLELYHFLAGNKDATVHARIVCTFPKDVSISILRIVEGIFVTFFRSLSQANASKLTFYGQTLQIYNDIPSDDSAEATPWVCLNLRHPWQDPLHIDYAPKAAAQNYHCPACDHKYNYKTEWTAGVCVDILGSAVVCESCNLSWQKWTRHHYGTKGEHDPRDWLKEVRSKGAPYSPAALARCRELLMTQHPSSCVSCHKEHGQVASNKFGTTWNPMPRSILQELGQDAEAGMVYWCRYCYAAWWRLDADLFLKPNLAKVFVQNRRTLSTVTMRLLLAIDALDYYCRICDDIERNVRKWTHVKEPYNDVMCDACAASWRQVERRGDKSFDLWAKERKARVTAMRAKEAAAKQSNAKQKKVTTFFKADSSSARYSREQGGKERNEDHI